MHVTLLGPYPPPHGGVQTHLVALRHLVRSSGHRCSVINITRHRSREEDDVFHPATAVGLLRRLVQLRPDVVHLHVGGIFPPRVQALAAACTCMPGSASVFTLHSGGYPESAAGRAAGRWTSEGIVLRRFDAVIGVNPTHDALFRRLGVPEHRIHRIAPHPVARRDEVEQAHGREDVEAFLARHAPALVSVGLLEDEYDFPFQFEVLDRLRRTHGDAGLLIIGSGSREAALREQVARHPARQAILLAGDVAHPATLRAIANADVVLRTTRFDGDAVSVREALQLGSPVVASENGMRPPGVLTYPVGDAAACLARVEEALGRPAGGEATDLGELDRVLALYQALARAPA